MTYGFMPGCSLSSYAPDKIALTINYLKEFYPDLVSLQLCCGKPTRYLGQQDLFEARFATFEAQVEAAGVDQLILACQGCFSTVGYSKKIKPVSLWTVLNEVGLPENLKNKAKDSDMIFAIHDPCPTRDNIEIHAAIREIIRDLGYHVEEVGRTGKNTVCCGMGGMCGVSNPKLAQSAMKNRVEELGQKNIVTYCSSCRSAMMTGGGNSWHILDLIWGDVVYQNSTAPKDVLAHPVQAWMNRWQTKQKMKKI